jgi:uncharacterized protein (TIGR02757 family)
MPTRIYEKSLCELYETYNHREYVHPDPLEFLYHYPDPKDREVVGLIASCLAYGSVHQILKSVASVLEPMQSPHNFLKKASKRSLLSAFKGFKYRFTTGEELATMLYGIKSVLERHGSLHRCFHQGLRDDHEDVLPALSLFVKELSSVFEGRPRSLLPSPEAGSACKRLNLYLRWMVRRDRVDPGDWESVPASKLIVPLDIHMHRISLRLGLTERKQANLRAACEITNAFRAIEPDDPVRYDFCLTRLGIRDDLTPDAFLEACMKTRD